MSNRVTQLDVLDLDSYITDLLVRQEVDKCLMLSSSPLLLQLKPWLKSAVYAALLYNTAGKFHQTVAQRLFGVILTTSQSQKARKWRIPCYVAAETMYFWWNETYGLDHPQFLDRNPKVEKIVNLIHSFSRIARLLNFLFFLKNGYFSNILLLLLGLKLTYERPEEANGAISYTILSREILWRGFAEILMESLMNLNLDRLKRYLTMDQSLKFNKDSSQFKHCCICSEWPTQPRESYCGHVSCYYCASVCILEGRNCPVCNAEMKSIKRIVLTS